MSRLLRRVATEFARLVRSGAAVADVPRTTSPAGRAPSAGVPPSTGPAPPAASGGGQPAGGPALEYRPREDGRPDPGEVVWAWVAYEDDPARGKDRPVLVVAREGAQLVGLMLTSKDHDRDQADEARWGRHWMDVGTGGWDPRGRPSEARLDRVLRLDPAGVRREGASLDKARFDAVADALRALHGWR